MPARTILFAAANPGDVLLFASALQRRNPELRLHHVANDRRAREYFSGAGQFADRTRHPLPDVAVIDGQLPDRSGFDLLRWLKGQAPFKSVPVIVLTKPACVEEERAAMELGATTYVSRSYDWAPLLDNLVYILNAPTAFPDN